jgi:hypothetical protein
MKNYLRVLTAALLLAACITAAAPGTVNAKQGFQEGPAPVPLCDPNDPKCKMPIPPAD